MTKIERFEERIRELKKKSSLLMRSGEILKSMRLNNEIEEIKKEIENLRPFYERKPLSEMISKEELKEMNIVPLMIECHLISDMLVEICYKIVDKCKEHGLDNVSFVPSINEIIKKSEVFASFLTGLSPELRDLLLRNQMLNESLHKKYLNYIENRLKYFNKNDAI